MSKLALLSPSQETGAHTVERVLVTESGHSFVFVTQRPLFECANEMVRSAAHVLGVTGAPVNGDEPTVRSETREGKKQKKQARPVATPT